MHAVWPSATSQESHAPGYLEPLRLRYDKTREEEYTIQEYLEICKRDHSAYATASERMLAAIGEPELVDTRHDQRLSRIFPTRSSRFTRLSASSTAPKR
jgi:predicted Ser/Thr protein kinase